MKLDFKYIGATQIEKKWIIFFRGSWGVAGEIRLWIPENAIVFYIEFDEFHLVFFSITLGLKEITSSSFLSESIFTIATIRE